MFPERCVSCRTNQYSLCLMCFFESCTETRFSIQKIGLLTRRRRFRRQIPSKPYCVKVRFVMLLWKMSLIVFHVGTESVVTTLVERHISHFVDYCPSLEFGTLTQVRFMEADESQLTVFQKIVSIRMPPKTCLPFTDKLCFECLFTSLSPKNIAKALAAVVQERRVLLVSEQMDSLTLCAQALNSLLYPFRWYHPFIPILPLTITESISV